MMNRKNGNGNETMDSFLKIDSSNSDQVLKWFIKSQTSSLDRIQKENQRNGSTHTINVSTININNNNHQYDDYRHQQQHQQQQQKQQKQQQQQQQKIRHPIEELDIGLGVIDIDYLKKATSMYTVGLLNRIDIKRKSCEMIIEELFYSETRSSIYYLKTSEIIDKLKMKLKTYYDINKQMNIKINKSEALKFFIKSYNDLSIIYESSDRIVKRTPSLPKNEQFVKLAVDIIIEQWKVICLTPWGLENTNTLHNSFPEHCLAILNYLSKGGKRQKIQKNQESRIRQHSMNITNTTNLNGMTSYAVCIDIIPESKYAIKYFPPNKDLKYYGFDKNMITIGTKNLMLAYNSIKKDNLNIPTSFLSNTII